MTNVIEQAMCGTLPELIAALQGMARTAELNGSHPTTVYVPVTVCLIESTLSDGSLAHDLRITDLMD